MIENLYGEARRPDSGNSAPTELSVIAELANLASPYAVRVAATLRLADLVEAGTHELEELAAAAGADPDALCRLMRYLACRGVFAEQQPGVFTMTESARVLTTTHPMQIRGWLDLEGPAAGRMDVSFTELLAAVRTGKPAYPKIFGRPVWEDLEDHPDMADSFGALMASRAASFAADVVNCYDWNGITQVVDVGGGSGQVLTRLLQVHLAMNGTLVDLPAIASLAQSTFDAAGIANRASAVEGNIFDTLPVGGQLYLLASILHDWNDHEAIAVLRRCAEAAGAGQRILVVDRTSEHGNSLTFTFMNLLMLVFLGGKERTIAEFAELGQAAGLSLESANPIPCGLSLITYLVNEPDKSASSPKKASR